MKCCGKLALRLERTVISESIGVEKVIDNMLNWEGVQEQWTKSR